MAKALRDHWQPVFNSPNPSDHSISEYLNGYQKHIRKHVHTLCLADFVDEASRRRSSTTGPDGIPFSFYRVLIDIAAPLLFRFTLHVAWCHRANKSFNYTNIFFFPKDSTFTPGRQRPISVGNTDNRIIASVTRKKITPAILDILSRGQTAFNPSRTISGSTTTGSTQPLRISRFMVSSCTILRMHMTSLPGASSSGYYDGLESLIFMSISLMSSLTMWLPSRL